MRSNESDRKNLSSLELFLQTDTVRILPFIVLLLPNQKNEQVSCGDPISGSERPDSQANS
jgi:hypothetical protein